MDYTLNDKQRAFVEAYLNCWNASEAARRAGYSTNCAGEQGYDLLKKTQVQAAIAARLNSMKLTADRTLQLLSDHAHSTLDDFFSLDEDGQPALDLLKAQERGKMHLVKKISYDRLGNPVIELHSVQGALTLLARHHGLLNDKLTHDFSTLSDADLLRRAQDAIAGTSDASAAPEPSTVPDS